MASNIDPTKPTTGTALTADVRANFQHAYDEITDLQAAVEQSLSRQNDGHIASAGEHVIMDNSAGAVTMYLPASPTSGDKVTVHAYVLLSTFSVTVNGNGVDIMIVGDSSMVLDIDNGVFQFYYDSVSNIWKLILLGTVAR